MQRVVTHKNVKVLDDLPDSPTGVKLPGGHTITGSWPDTPHTYTGLDGKVYVIREVLETVDELGPYQYLSFPREMVQGTVWLRHYVATDGILSDVKRIVDAERDRRIAKGIVFRGVLYQTRPQDFTEITGAALLSALAVINGSKPGDFRWSDQTRDFTWIAEDNTEQLMDAHTCLEFAKAVAVHKSRHIRAGVRIKKRLRQGEDLNIYNEELWS